MSQVEVVESADKAIFVEIVNDMVAKIEAAMDGKTKIGENVMSGQNAAQAIEDDIIFLSSDSEYDSDSDVVIVAEVFGGVEYQMGEDEEEEEMDEEMDEEYEEEDEEEEEEEPEIEEEVAHETPAKKAKLE